MLGFRNCEKALRMSSDVIISVKNVSKRYELYRKPEYRLFQMLCAGKKNFFDEFWALKGISFEVRRGESIGIIGRNGAGKSTLLQVLTGTLRPTTGTIRKQTGLRVALLQIGTGFNPEFTGRENVYMNASILGLEKSTIDKRYQEIIEFADIGKFIDQPVKKYSSGMLARLGFAVQIMVEPDVLIIDEALSVGDVFFKQKCLHRLRLLKEKGCTLLFVSHSMESVRSFCEKALYLKNGQMVAFGDSEPVCNLYWNGDNKALKDKPSKSEPSKPQSDNLLGYFEDEKLPSRVSERAGSGDVRIVGVRLLNETGQSVQAIGFREKVKMTVSLKAERPVPAGTVFAFSFNLPNFKAVVSRFSLQHGLSVPEMRAGDRFVITTEFVQPFRRGTWFLNLSLRADQTVDQYYDHIFNAAGYTVPLPEAPPEERDWSYVQFEKIEMHLKKVD